MFGEVVREHRGRLGLTQEELAERAGVSVRAIGKIEANRIAEPRASTVRLLADALDLSGRDRDRFLAAASRRGADSTAELPAQLPPAVPGFTGRVGHVATLDALLTNGDGRAATICVVSGPPGVGKTAIAVHWADRVKRFFPDGQLYIDLQGFHPSDAIVEPTTALRVFLHALGVSPRYVPDDFASQVGLYRTMTAGRRLLIVLDNARDGDQVRPLMPTAPGCLTLITSRDPMLGLAASDGARLINLDPLSPDEATALLAARLGPARLAAEPQAVAHIVARCAGLPIALAVAAARAAGRPDFSLAALAMELRAERSSLQPFHLGETTTDVRAVFSWSYRTLTAAAARTFRLFALHPAVPAGEAAVASLLGQRPVAQRRHVAELVRANLLSEPLPRRYGLHDLLRTYALELSATGGGAAQATRARRRMLDYYVCTAYEAARCLQPYRQPFAAPVASTGVTLDRIADYAAAITWFTSEQPALMALVDEADRTGFDRHGWQLAWCLTTFLRRQGQWHDLKQVHYTALRCAERSQDAIGIAHAHRGRALACSGLGQVEQAHTAFVAALDQFASAGDPTGQGEVHLDLAMVMQGLDRPDEALAHAESALDLFRSESYRYGEANALNAVGWHYAGLGDYHKTLTICARALALLEDLGDQYGRAATLHSIGYAQLRLGNRTEAIRRLRQAVLLSHEAGDPYHEAVALGDLGEAHEATGDIDAARTAVAAAVELLNKLRHPDAAHARASLVRLGAVAAAGAGRP